MAFCTFGGFLSISSEIAFMAAAAAEARGLLTATEVLPELELSRLKTRASSGERLAALLGDRTPATVVNALASVDGCAIDEGGEGSLATTRVVEGGDDRQSFTTDSILKYSSARVFNANVVAIQTPPLTYQAV